MSLTGKTEPPKVNNPEVAKDTIIESTTTPSLSELLGIAQDSITTPDGMIDDSRRRLTEQRLKERETERVGIEKYYELRDRWSRYICAYVWAMLIFQFVLIFSIGFDWLDFAKYPLFINLVLGQNFAQVVGMGVIVAKFLFSSPKTIQNKK